MKRLVLCSSVVGLGMALAAGLSPSRAADAPTTPPAAAATPDQIRFFELKVRPVLATHCFGCHGAARQVGGLRLDGRAAALKGGGAGPAVVPGKPERSPLIQAINHSGLKMPPAGKLKPEEIAALTEWVRIGAPWPEPNSAQRPGGGPGKTVGKPVDPRSHWAFRPMKRAPVPVTSDGGWSRTGIDRFVFQRLKVAGLSPSPEADRTSLLRRVTFDLTGLPPTPEEVDQFVSDPSPHAYEKQVDRLLASPRYGEKWARHWLDLVRYADSDGYRIDDYRPNAWLYRDYVIKSFNEDKPYDRFVHEQLAGDELFPGDPSALVATGYLRHWIYEYNSRDARGQWTTILNDITDTTGDVFMGLGLQCARCHDHKFDPILQKDYFRLQAFFAPLLPRDDLPAATPDEVKAHAARMAGWNAKTATLRSQIEAIEAHYRPKAAESAIIKFPLDVQEIVRTPAEKRPPYDHQIADLVQRQVDYEYGRLETHIKGEDKEKLLALRKQLSAFDAEKPAPLSVPLSVTDVGPHAPPIHIPKKPAGTPPVEPGYLTLFDHKPAQIQPLPTAPNSTGRRTALARWLTRPENPLTARVMVNRVWQYHFGRGLAANASDFGKLGEPPTHPELLDYLALRFAAPGGEGATSDGLGWSLKKLHRLILLSATYRQSATAPSKVYASKSLTGTKPTRSPIPHSALRTPHLIDPENRLLWRGTVRRLDAEQIRDALLAVTGELNLKTGGPGVVSKEPRRTIYTRIMRNSRDPLLDVFDLPQFFVSSSSRDTTTTPVQSLLLINSQSMLLRSRALAARLEREASTDEERVVRAYRLAFGRAPASDELAGARKFLEEQARRIDPNEAGSAAAAFLHDRLPFRDGQAAVFSPGGAQQRLDVPHHAMLPDGDFTIESFFVARSVYDSASVRTLVAKWNGDTKAAGWGLGISGKQSRRKPQTVVLQLIGKKLDGTVGEEALFSDQSLQLNKPYYVSASVQLATAGKPGTATFYLKDLSNDDEPLLIAKVAHTITGGLANQLPLTIGGRDGGRESSREGSFDGLIDDVRLSSTALDVPQLLFTAEGVNRHTVGYWPFEAKPDVFRDMSGNRIDILPGGSASRKVDARKVALEDLCHVLLNSSEFLYVQ